LWRENGARLRVVDKSRFCNRKAAQVARIMGTKPQKRKPFCRGARNKKQGVGGYAGIGETNRQREAKPAVEQQKRGGARAQNVKTLKKS